MDKLSFRYMDEIFAIERSLGEIASVIGLQYGVEPTTFEDQKWEEFAQPVVEEKKIKVAGEGEEEDAQAPAAEPEADETKK